MIVWYLVLVYYGGGGLVTIPQPNQATCVQNARYMDNQERMHSFCIAGTK
jgi:hypothetical protein